VATHSSSPPLTVFERIWPWALVMAGLGLTVAWISLLAYEFVGWLGTTL
jgi:hypothetical protein